MQDNELDELFRAKLNGFEVDPDGHVWNNISAELGSNKKKSVVPVLRIAASVLIVLGIGTWFAVRPTTPKAGGKAENQVVRTKNVKPTEVTKAENVHVDATPAVEQQTVIAQTTSTEKINQMAKVKQSVKKSEPEKSIIPTVAEPQPQTTQPQQLAAIETNKLKPVLPEVPLTITADAETVQPKAINTVAAVSEEQQATKKRVKKRGINSFGDLINVVVAKVDKREDKLVEFTDTDGDEATITGINLGIIKVKKEK
ncbi:hypothetical protein KHS38_07075 [Mucilaginibacter sp. Bleaf8]|nr:hypothetical protein [Mucilaginibacter sp. Bleaf8]